MFVNATLVREGLARVSARTPLTRLDELPARGARGAGISPRHVGRRAADSGAGLYSPVGSQPASRVQAPRARTPSTKRRTTRKKKP